MTETYRAHERPTDVEFAQMIASARASIHQAIDPESRPWWRRLSRLTTALVILVSAGGVVGGAYAATQVLSAPDPAVSMPVAPPKAGDEMKIGPWDAAKPAPDLVPIDLEDGRSGFLRTYDMAYGSDNPAFIRKTSEHSHDIVLPVYAKDGQTVIGEFIAGSVSWK